MVRAATRLSDMEPRDIRDKYLPVRNLTSTCAWRTDPFIGVGTTARPDGEIVGSGQGFVWTILTKSEYTDLRRERHGKWHR